MVQIFLKQNFQSAQEQVQQVNDGAWMLKQLIVLFNLNCNFVRPAAYVFLVNLSISSLRMKQNFRYFQMKQFLFYFRVHQNLVRNISFQKSFVDVSMKPLLTQKLIDQTQGHYILSLKLLSSSYASLIVLLETEVCEIFYNRNEDVFRVIFLELRRDFRSFQLVCCFFDIIVWVGIAALSGLVFIHLSDQLGFQQISLVRV